MNMYQLWKMMCPFIYNAPLQITPASSLCWQLLWSVPEFSMVHFVSLVSLLVHWTLDKWMDPLPSPKYAPLVGIPIGYNIAILFDGIRSCCDTSNITVSQLSAHCGSIIAVPVIVTHCPPIAMQADFHTSTFSVGTTDKSNVFFSAIVYRTGKYYRL